MADLWSSMPLNGANCNALLLQLSLVMLLCMHVIIPFAYGKIKTIQKCGDYSIDSRSNSLPDRPKQKITIIPLRMTLNTVYAPLTKISMNIKVYCLGLSIRVRLWVRYVMAKTVTGQISGRHGAGYWIGHDRSTGHDWASMTGDNI